MRRAAEGDRHQRGSERLAVQPTRRMTGRTAAALARRALPR